MAWGGSDNHRFGAFALAGLMVSCTRLNPAFGDGQSGTTTDSLDTANTDATTSTTTVGESTVADATSGSSQNDLGGSLSAASEDDTGKGESSSGKNPTDPWGGWTLSEPIPIEELNSPANDDDPTLREDLLEIYFASNRTGNEEIYVATRRFRDDLFEPPEPVVELNSTASDTAPDLTPDGLFLVFASDRAVGSSQDIYVSERESWEQPWSAPLLLEDLSSPAAERGVAFDVTRGDLVFCSNRLGLDTLFIAPWTSFEDGFDGVEEWDIPGLEPTKGSSDCMPWIDPSGSLLLFASNRTSDDRNLVYVAFDEESEAIDWGDVPTVNTGFQEDDPWYSSTHHILVWASRATGNWDLYYATN